MEHGYTFGYGKIKKYYRIAGIAVGRGVDCNCGIGDKRGGFKDGWHRKKVGLI